MPAPGTYPDWDTNGTHTTPVTGGHTTDGYAHDEIPTSDETNQFFMLVGLWVRYLALFLTDFVNSFAWHWKMPNLVDVPNSSTVPTLVPASYSNGAGGYATVGGVSSSGYVGIAIDVPQGFKLQAIGIVTQAAVPGSATIAYLLRNHNGVSTTVAGAGSPFAGTLYVPSTSGSFTKYENNLNADEVPADGDQYTLMVFISTGDKLVSVGYKLASTTAP